MARLRRDDLQTELTGERLVRTFRGIEIYVVDATCAPRVMEEIGRIREVEFSREGGGTGRQRDIDEFDTQEPQFRQLVAWDPDNVEVVGLYRFQLARNALRIDGTYSLPTARLFDFSRRFQQEILADSIELGRSVVNREARRAVMGLAAAWAGLGALVVDAPDCRFFFGKVTLYPTMNQWALSAILSFLEKHCAAVPGLARPRPELQVDYRLLPGWEIADSFSGDYSSDYQMLLASVADRGESIPPLLISYLRTSRSLRYFGAARNPHFGDVIECAILIRMSDIRGPSRHRYIDTYRSSNPQALLGCSTPVVVS